MSLFERFYEYEYALLHEGRTKELNVVEGVRESLIKSNMVDSDEFRAKRRMSYGKLCSMVELFSKASALNKLSPAQTENLIKIMTRLLTS